MSHELTLGYIGLGNMGAPMATRMAEWPGGVTVYDVRTEAMTPLAEKGATLADSMADVAGADIVHITVLDDAQVRDVVAQLVPHARRDTVIAIHSTIRDSTAAELAAELGPRGIHVVDAPVSGGAAAAAEGKLATMVGADRDVYERIKPAFKHWAAMVVHAGEPGAGTRMKLARNMLTFTGFAAVGEAWKLADAAGLNLQDLGNVVRYTDKLTGGPGSIMYRDDANDLPGEHFLHDPFLHTRALGEKDLGLALSLADAVGVDLPLARYALENLAAGLGVPHTEKDT